MAVIRGFRHEVTGHGSRHATDVDGLYFDFLDERGERILQLSTLGSDQRQSKPKVSQTIQIGPDAARDLARILDEVFSLNLTDGRGWWSDPSELSRGEVEVEVEGQATADQSVEAVSRPRIPWVEELVESPTYLAQRALVGRAGLDDDMVLRVLSALIGRDGRGEIGAVEREAGLGHGRLRAMVPALRRLLNVDGYAAVEVQDRSTLVLHGELLRHQFGIDDPMRPAEGERP